MQIDAYLLDWNQRRPLGGKNVLADTLAAFAAGRYEYSFSLPALANANDITLCEQAYLAQGNGGTKIRVDRQSMSIGDVVVVSGAGFGGRAYVCDIPGFTRVPALDEALGERIEASWERWTTTPEEDL